MDVVRELPMPLLVDLVNGWGSVPRERAAGRQRASAAELGTGKELPPVLAGVSDDELERRVDEVLAEVGLSDWEVTVTDGAVQLTGPADSPYRQTARAVAESIPGVVDVQVRP